MKNKIQIVFTGAQGTGKTTLTNILSEKFNINSFSVSRDIAVDSGWTAESKGSVKYQKELFNKLLKKISSKKSFISDRALSCVAGYTFKHALDNMEDNNFKNLADDQYTKFCKFHNNREITRMPLKFLLLHDTPNLKANSRNTAFYVYHRAYHEPKAYYDFF